jgi:hypothetical protein
MEKRYGQMLKLTIVDTHLAKDAGSIEIHMVARLYFVRKVLI